jgi:photosystem II stability/assembly factor-like uncharacterized protein
MTVKHLILEMCVMNYRHLVAAWLLAACVSPAYCQHWNLQNPLPATDNLNDVVFAGANFGWAVGDCGAIVHTSDGGATWALQNTGRMDTLLSVAFVDDSCGWAAGLNGAVLHTINGGTDWILHTTGTMARISGVAFADRNNGWAAGDSGLILHTINGGELWLPQASGVQKNLRSIAFIDANRGWAVGDSGTIVHTTDGGSTWTAQNSGTGASLLDIDLIDSQNAWITCSGGSPFPSGFLLRTTDGGSTWTQIWAGCIPYRLRFTDPNTGWILGVGYGTWGVRMVAHTTDGGATWSNQYFPWDGYLHSIEFADQNHGFVVGEAGTILQTTDSGVHWTFRPNGITQGLSSVSFINANRGWISGGDGLLMLTTDGGASWTERSCGTTDDISCIRFVDGMCGWVATGVEPSLDNGGYGIIRHTTDGGETWAGADTSLHLDAPCRDMDFIDQNRGWALRSGMVHRTTDGGRSWTRHEIPAASWDGYDIEAADSQHVYVTGTYGHTFESHDGGDTWYVLNSPTTNTLLGMDFIGDRGWIVGFGGMILKVRFGVFMGMQTCGTQSLRSVDFIDQNYGWAVGDSGTILHTTNGGNVWTAQESGTTRNLSEVHFFNANHGWAVGAYGTILHYTSGSWTVENADDLPVSFRLEQNFPNPFNPTTEIRFELPQTAHVELSIFNTLGRRVATLMDDVRPAGSYRISWNGTTFASGMYIYQLKSGNFVDTKKMILVR